MAPSLLEQGESRNFTHLSGDFTPISGDLCHYIQRMLLIAPLGVVVPLPSLAKRGRLCTLLKCLIMKYGNYAQSMGITPKVWKLRPKYEIYYENVCPKYENVCPKYGNYAQCMGITPKVLDWGKLGSSQTMKNYSQSSIRTCSEHGNNAQRMKHYAKSMGNAPEVWERVR